MKAFSPNFLPPALFCRMTRLLFTLSAWLLFFYLPSCSLSAPHAQHAPQVKRHGATFIGKIDDYYGVSTWLGIRYAQPPIGSLRLQPPQKVDNDGTISATSFGAQCFQLSTPANATNNISEDCLYLNIYKPSDAALKEHYDEDDDDDEDSRSMPVMFFIHGGAFNDGSGESYDARSLVNTSVALHTPTIVVTINYRLSFFGFSGRCLRSLRHHIV
jgi:carboxylesterase type B